LASLFHDVATFTALKSWCDACTTLRSSRTLADATNLPFSTAASLTEPLRPFAELLNDARDWREQLGGETPTTKRWTHRLAPANPRLPA
jgi:hypothetical protein